MSLEKLILNESQDHRNNDIRSVNAISITEESPSRDCEQVINLNKNNLSPSHTKDKIPPNDQCAGSNINNTDSTSDAPLPKQQTSSSLKDNLLVEQKEEINLLKNDNLNLKLQLDRATNRVKNNRFADSPKSYIPCPFLFRRGWCFKGNQCNFLHAKPFPNKHKHRIPCPFLRKGFV
jgi:hypothetical protein